MSALTQSQFYSQLKKYYRFYTGGFIAFVIVLAILEQMGVPNVDAYWKSKTILCRNSIETLENAFNGKVLQKVECSSSEVDDNIKLADKIGITGPPTIVFSDGRIRSGMMPADQIIFDRRQVSGYCFGPKRLSFSGVGGRISRASGFLDRRNDRRLTFPGQRLSLSARL